MSKEAMQLALEALEKVITAFGSGLTLQQNAITALRQALETEQKTAVSPDGGTGFIDGVWYGPPQRKPLTDEQIIKHFQEHVDTGSLLSFADGVRFAEAAHGINP